MPFTTQDLNGKNLVVGDMIRVLDVTPDPELEEDQQEMFMDMIGARCAIERIDADGTGWVAVWRNGDEGTQLTLVGLAPCQMERQAD